MQKVFAVSVCLAFIAACCVGCGASIECPKQVHVEGPPGYSTSGMYQKVDDSFKPDYKQVSWDLEGDYVSSGVTHYLRYWAGIGAGYQLADEATGKMFMGLQVSGPDEVCPNIGAWKTTGTWEDKKFTVTNSTATSSTATISIATTANAPALMLHGVVFGYEHTSQTTTRVIAGAGGAAGGVFFTVAFVFLSRRCTVREPTLLG